MSAAVRLIALMSQNLHVTLMNYSAACCNKTAKREKRTHRFYPLSGIHIHNTTSKAQMHCNYGKYV